MENKLQTRRIIYILTQLFHGKKITVNSLYNELIKENPTLTRRTIQRDLIIIQQELPFLEDDRTRREVVWYIPTRHLSISKFGFIETNEILSLYFLKAYLKLFEGTIIEEQVMGLSRKIEELAPEDIIPQENFFGDKNIGYFDYSKYDPQIRQIIRCVQQKQLLDVEYQPIHSHEPHKIQVIFRMLFTYSEMLYVIAYVPKHNSNIALTIQNIIEIYEHDQQFKALPKFDFYEWSKDRFGVFWGDAENVEIEIKSDYLHYFENRIWHASQKFVSIKNSKNKILKMKVPLAPDFIAWVLSWGNAAEVKKPKKLIEIIKDSLEKNLSIYKNSETKNI